MESEHRKIELQSPADLTHLTHQIRSAALQKLNLHLPPAPNASTSEPDDLRVKTEELVDAFVAQVLDGMRRNISINGMDVSDTQMVNEKEGMQGVEVEEFEDLDNKLREKLRNTIARRDALVGKIAMHRRTTAEGAGRRFREEFLGEIEGLERAREEGVRCAEGVGEEVKMEVEVKRLGEVEKSWERAIEGLTRLNTGLPETRARLERAGEVVSYLEGKEKSVS